VISFAAIAKFLLDRIYDAKEIAKLLAMLP